MELAEDLLRRLAFNDEKALSMVLTRPRGGEAAAADLSPKVELLVQLAAMLAVGASPTLLDEIVAQASAEGATEIELVGVLVAIGSALGLAGLVASASRLAAAIGYDLENGSTDPPPHEGRRAPRERGSGRAAGPHGLDPGAG